MKKAVVDSTINQINALSSEYSFNDIETVYIGGGTPTSLPVSLLEKLIFSIDDSVKSEIKEFSIEINPETVDMETVYFLRDTPLTRLSTGIQSFDDRFLMMLGRRSTSDVCRNSLDLLKKTDRELNIDIISSIPGQKSGDSINDIKNALFYKPEHISLYSLTIEENTPIADYLNINDIDDDIWLETSEYLENSGFDHYEISNFAQNNHKCIHNLNGWKMKPYLGFGPAAVSTIIENNRPFRIFNTQDLSLFLEDAESRWNMKKEEISIKDFLIETLMMGFRTSEGIDTDLFSSSFSSDIYGIIPETIIKWINKGMLLKSDTNLTLTGRGRLFHSSFIIDIMNELEDKKNTFVLTP